MTEIRLSFSVVVPTRNRPQQLRACLGALAALDYPATRFEVIVVDDGSHPRVDVPIDSRLEGRLTWVRQPNAGPAAARNAGAMRARHDYLAFTDDDCVPDSAWLKRLAGALERTPRAVVGGRTINALPDNVFATASQRIVEAARAHFFATRSPFRFFASNNLALLAEIFRAVNGFDSAFRTSEDRDLCDRCLGARHALVYAPDAVVHHGPALTLAGFSRQHFRYGRGAYRFHRARSRRGAGPFRPELSFYGTAFRHLVAPPTGGQTFSLAALFVLWQAANAAGFLWEGLQGTAEGEAERKRRKRQDGVDEAAGQPATRTFDTVHLFRPGDN